MAIGRIPEPGTGIPESIVDAKGDLVTATAADTPARLAVGTNEHRLVAASGETTGLKYVADTTNYAIAAKGDLLVGTAADTLQALSVGTNGHTLVADSSTSTGLKWEAASSGGMTQLATGTLSGSSVAITSISGSYKDLQLVIRNYKPSTDIDMSMRFNNDSTSNRHRRILIVGDGTGGIYNAQFNTTSVVITAYNDDTVANGLIIIDVFDYANTSTWKMFGVESMETNGSTTTNFNFECVRGFYNQTGAITEINLFPNSGTFTSGDYILYGVK